MNFTAVSGIVLLGALAGCGDADVLESGPMLELVRVFSAGDALGGEGNPLFGLVNDAEIDPAGGILVLDTRPPALHRYAANGDWLGQIGREGEGPGEYRQPTDVAVLEDGRIVLWDPGLARLTVYSADGQPEASHRLPNAMLSAARSMLTDRNGNVYVTAPDSREGPARPVLVKVDLRTMRQDTVRPPWPAQDIPRLMPLNAEVPFWPTDVWTMLSTGDIAASHRAAYEIFLLDANSGDTLRTITREQPGASVDPTEAEAYKSEVTKVFRRLDPAWSWSGPDIPREKPAIRALVPTADGELLIQTHQPATPLVPKPTRGVGWVEPQVFDIYGLDASHRGSFRMPPRTTLFRKRGNLVVALRRDEDGVHRVDVYELRNRTESERE